MNKGLYIHIPFCSKKCDYCDFVSYSMDKRAQQDYLDALCTEIDMVKSKYNNDTFDTIFIGGGTPSIMYEGFIAGLTRKLYSSFHFADKIEYTIEVNPSSFTREKFFEYAEAGINRISVGVQCLDSKLLAYHGRMQTIEEVQNTFKILTDARFFNVNADIIVGLPKQKESSVLETIRFLIDCKVKHISMYTLQNEKGTLLYDKVKRKKVKEMSNEKLIKIYKDAYELLKKNDFRRYEVSNYARPGFASLHNQKYWNGAEYVGLGVSAHSYVDGYRYHNTKRLDTYIDRMQAGQSAVYAREYVTDEERRTECIMLSLRRSKGLDLEKFKSDFNEDILRSRAEQINRLLKLDMIEIENGFLKIKDDYFYVSNSIIVDLI